MSPQQVRLFVKKQLTICLAILLAVLGGCGSANSDRDQDTLNRGLIGEPDSLDPHQNSTTQGHRVLVDIYEGLLRLSSDGQVELAVASEWHKSDDGKTYTFLIREDAVWSNGDPVTAQDFVESFRRLVNPSTRAFYAGFLSTVVNAGQILSGKYPPDKLGVEALGPRKLRIRLSVPTPYFPQLLAHPATSPVHESLRQEKRAKSSSLASHISNGAYVLESRTPGSKIALRKNPKYFESQDVLFDKVNYHIVVNEKSMFDRYRSGELDITETVPGALFDDISVKHKGELHVAPRLGVYYIGFNLTKPPFRDNLALRKALSLVIDRDALVRSITRRGETPAYNWVPPGIEGYEPATLDFATLPMGERIGIAQQLLDESSYNSEHALSFELRYNTSPSEERMVSAIRSIWAEALSAEVDLVNEEYKVLISNIQEMEVTQAFRLSWIGDYSDPYTFLQLFESGNPQNLTGYSNPEFDRLLHAATHVNDPDERMRLLGLAEERALADHAAIPLYFYVGKHLVKPYIAGWKNNTADHHPSKYLRLKGN